MATPRRHHGDTMGDTTSGTASDATAATTATLLVTPYGDTLLVTLRVTPHRDVRTDTYRRSDNLQRPRREEQLRQSAPYGAVQNVHVHRIYNCMCS